MISDPCRSCGSVCWYAKKTVVDGDSFFDRCSDCDRGLVVSTVPDVLFRPDQHGIERHPHITDDMGRPVPLLSRAHKAQVMKEKGIYESGDRRHGARGFDPISNRHAMDSLRK